MIAGRYRVEKEIGRGGAGVVHLAHDELLDRQVAVKRIGLLPGTTADDVSRAQREARLAAGINHQHVVSIFDLVKDEDSLKLIEEFYKAGKTVAAVCHGPIVFVNATVDGKPLLEGRRAAGFSNAEEEAVGLTGAMPVLLEDEVKRVGGDYVKAEALWKEMVVVDGQIITGQNPASAQGVGAALATAVG